jgi:hypothetical protein
LILFVFNLLNPVGGDAKDLFSRLTILIDFSALRGASWWGGHIASLVAFRFAQEPSRRSRTSLSTSIPVFKG